jgi:seryl-tRNA synthetase
MVCTQNDLQQGGKSANNIQQEDTARREEISKQISKQYRATRIQQRAYEQRAHSNSRALSDNENSVEHSRAQQRELSRAHGNKEHASIPATSNEHTATTTVLWYAYKGAWVMDGWEVMTRLVMIPSFNLGRLDPQSVSVGEDVIHRMF